MRAGRRPRGSALLRRNASTATSPSQRAREHTAFGIQGAYNCRLMGRRCSLRHALCLWALHLARLPIVHADEPATEPATAPSPTTTQPDAASGPPLAPSPAIPAPAAAGTHSAPLDPPAEVRLHENGRLAALLCQGQPLRLVRCRYGAVSGLVLSYHPSGSVAEVLAFRDGWLDGVAEVYDEAGHLLERTLYRAGLPVPLSQVATAAPSDPPLPLPPSVPADGPAGAVDPAAPGLSSAPRDENQAGSMPQAAGPSPSLRMLRALDSRSVFGLGLRGVFGGLVGSAQAAGLAGGQLVFALAPSAGTYPEISFGVTSTFDAKGAYRRVDVPVSFGLVVHLNRARAPIYMALGLDMLYARRFIPGDVPGPRDEEAYLLGGSAGFGVNMPMWHREQHRGRLLMDVRMGGTGRLDTGPALLIPQEAGEPQAAISSQFRVLLTLTAQVNFGG